MNTSATLPPDEAARTLASIHSTRDRIRGDLRSYWYPLVVFGLLTVLSAPFFWLWEGAGVGLFWLLAAPAGVALVARHYRRRELSVGVADSPRAHVLTCYALVGACFALGFGGGISGEQDIAGFGPPLAVAVAYGVFGWLERSAALVLLACLLGGLTVALALTDVEHASQMLAVAYGASFLILGVSARTRTPRP